MTDREYRLRVRIDQLTDERDRARALHLKWRRRAQSFQRQRERWRSRAFITKEEPMTAWKDLERRVCRTLGGERSGPLGKGCSDCSDEVPFSVEVKRSNRLGPPVLAKWITQARSHSVSEGRPWLVVVAGHHDHRPIACLDFVELVDLLDEAGRLRPSGDASLNPAEPSPKGAHPDEALRDTGTAGT